MRLIVACVLTIGLGPSTILPAAVQPDQIKMQGPVNPSSIDLRVALAATRLRGVNRSVTKLEESSTAVRVDEGAGPGVVWIEGTDFAAGTIELDVRGRDLLQKSFLGVAFHRKDDATYEAVYVRPFNFRADDPIRHKHAVQYFAAPDYDWPRLRQEFPDEFENPVDASVSPTDWTHLLIVVRDATIEAYVGAAKTPALRVRKLGSGTHGMIGLWVGNNSDGDFSNLKITASK